MKSKIRKIVMITLLLFLALKVFAPARESMILIGDNPINPFRTLIHAIGMVETQFDTLAYNPLEEATGYFQIRPIRLEDYNVRTGNKYTRKDLFNYYVSEKIFLYYAAEIGPYDLERVARAWNGSGAGTSLYWKQVKKYLN